MLNTEKLLDHEYLHYQHYTALLTEECSMKKKSLKGLKIGGNFY